MVKKIILDLCGGTGAWSKPYADNGYDVRVITLPEYDVTVHQFGNDWLTICDTTFEISDIYGILAAPPCTMFSLARTRAKKPRDFGEGMEVVRACLDIIWKVREKQKLAFWALENPMGYLRQFLGKPPLTFNPCDYGDPYTKKTDLWGYYNEPKKHPVILDEETRYRCSQNTRRLPSISEITGSKQAAKRAITPAGFAKAFYEANK
jgi:site-specific DNA-cytosine methylase